MGCIVITLYRDGKTVFSIQRPTVNGVHTIDVPSITEQFNDATMTQTMMGSTELHRVQSVHYRSVQVTLLLLKNLML